MLHDLIILLFFKEYQNILLLELFYYLIKYCIFFKQKKV